MRSRRSRLAYRGTLARGLVLGALACLAAAALGAAVARAEDEPGVARVSLIEGDASYLRGDADDWTGVSVNAPLVTGDRFYSGADSRAEIQLDPAVYARLSSETELDMLELGPDTTQVRLPVGLVTLRLRRSPGGRHVEIDTPGAAVVVERAGIYRVHVERNGDTDLQVRDGAATVYVGGESYEIGDGRGVRIDGVGEAARPRVYAVSGGDGWDQWEAERARRVEGAASYRYVSDEIYGAEDLDEYGDWEYRSDYGHVWRPRYVDAGWAPYTDGRWVWVDPWGWTWLGYEPWGWAPYHYGRWVYLDSYWAWAPGPIVASPVYAPALVGWFGAGFGWGGVSVSVGFGPTIGWVPLGWGEPCFPWWGGWGGYVVGAPWWGGWGGPRIYNNVVINKNITNININNYEFGNLRKPGGFSTVPVRDFLGGRSGRYMPPGAGRSNFQPIGGRVPVVPTRESLPATNPSRVAVGRTVQPSGEAVTRQVVSARTPVGGQPSFERKLPLLERSGGAPVAPATLRELRAEGGRSPLVRTLAPVGVGTGGRSLERADAGRTLPGAAPDGAAVRSGRRTASITAPDADATAVRRSAIGGASGGRGFPERSTRSVARPPAVTREAWPTAPRDGGARQPYVARRPTWDGSGGTSTVGSRNGSAPRSSWTAGDRAPRSLGSSGGRSSSAGPQQRSSGSRTWFSQPRTLAPSGPETRTAPRSYASTGSRGGSASRSAPPTRGSSAPQIRSAPAPSAARGSATPRTSGAPRTSSAPRSYAARSASGSRTYAAPGFSGGRAAPSAPSFSGRSMPSGAGFPGRTSGSSRSFAGSGTSGRSLGGMGSSGRMGPSGGGGAVAGGR